VLIFRTAERRPVTGTGGTDGALAATLMWFEDPPGLATQRGPAGVVHQRVAAMTNVALAQQPAQPGAARDLEQGGQTTEPELAQSRPAGHHLDVVVNLVVGGEDSAYVVLADPAAAQLLGERLLALERLCSQHLGSTDNSVLKREILECVQRVVMHEETQRRLLGQKMRDIVQDTGYEGLRIGARFASRLGRDRNRLTRRGCRCGCRLRCRLRSCRGLTSDTTTFTPRESLAGR